MSFKSQLDDSFMIKRNMEKNAIRNGTELQQGKNLLRRRRKMKQSVRIRSKDLMKSKCLSSNIRGVKEGFSTVTPVKSTNTNEIKSLGSMQNNLNNTLQSEQDILKTIQGSITKSQEEQLQKCLKAQDPNADPAKKRAYLLGCIQKQLATAEATARIGKAPFPILAGLGDFLLGALAATALLAIVLSMPGSIFAMADAMAVAEESASVFEAAAEIAGEALQAAQAASEAASEAVAEAVEAGGDAAVEAVQEATEAAEQAAEDLKAAYNEANRLKDAAERIQQWKNRMQEALNDLQNDQRMYKTWADMPEELQPEMHLRLLGQSTLLTSSATAGIAAAVGGGLLLAGAIDLIEVEEDNKKQTGKQLLDNFFQIHGYPKTDFDDMDKKAQDSWMIYLASLPGFKMLTKTEKDEYAEDITLQFYKQKSSSNNKEGYTNAASYVNSYRIRPGTGKDYTKIRQGDPSFFEKLVDPTPLGTYGANDSNEASSIVDTLNNKLASSPQYKVGTGLWLQPENAVAESATTLDQMKDIDPTGINTTLKKASGVFTNLLQGLENDPVVKQMESVSSTPHQIEEGIKLLEDKWKEIFEKSCQKAIGVHDGTNPDGTSKFKGHQQYCKSWTNTREGRSGFFQNWWVDSDGKKNRTFFGNETDLSEDDAINLKNEMDVGSEDDWKNGRRGCDVAISGTRKNNLGGAGYCTCVDGTMVFMDEGHPEVSCNDMCNPANLKNRRMKGTKKVLFYQNTNVWTPEAIPPGAKYKSGVEAYNQKSTRAGGPWLQCYDEDTGNTPKCPEGLKPWPKQGVVQYPTKLPNGEVAKAGPCGTWKDIGALDTGEQLADMFDPFGTPYPIPLKGKDERYCVLPLPGPPTPGAPKENSKSGPGSKGIDSLEDNGLGLKIPKGYTKLPSPTELVDTCSSASYPNMYIEILKFRVLSDILKVKSKIMANTVKVTVDGVNKTKLEQSIIGKKLLKDMKIYKKKYKNFFDINNKKNQLDGMYEDINFKSQSANISYYIWFILAISGMFLVIKKLKSSN
jgi:hypothetical protein